MPSILTIGAALTLTIVSGAPPQKFDLVCEGVAKSGPYLRRATPIKVRYIVDLEAGLWCKGTEGFAACPQVSKINEVTPTRYTFLASDPKGRPDFDYVDRQSGNFEAASSIGGRIFDKQSGTCTPAEFSGFPASRL